MRSAEPSTPSIPRRSLRLPAAFYGLVIFGITFLAYFPAIHGTQLWDDPAHITAPVLQNAHGLWQIWFKLGATQQYYPILHSAFWLEHQLWGDSVLGYHLVNIGLHATAACLFAVLLARVRPPARVRQPRWRTEWLAAAVFALHPVCVESVAWISEQKNTLSLVFYLLAALAYFRFDTDRRGRWYGLAFIFFILALLSKSVTATLPAAVLLVQYWRHGRLAWRRDVFPLLPWFVVGFGAGLFTAWVEHNYIGAHGAAFELTFLQRCFLAGRVVWFYLGKLFWPTDLSFIYPRWQVATTWSWALGLAALVAGLMILWRWRNYRRAPVVAALFFVGSLFPALGFFNVYPFVFSYVADHWQYLPCLGIIALTTEGIAAGLRRWIEKMPERRRPGTVSAGLVSASAVLMVLFTLTRSQAGIYRGVEILYSDTLVKNPNCWMAHNNLGFDLMEKGRLQESVVHFQAAIRLKPDFADAYNNLGNAFSKIPSRAAEAIPTFEQALRFDPAMPEAHGNLGAALVNTPGRLDEAIAHLRLALQFRPEFYRMHNSLGLALTKSNGHLPEAIAEFETALRFDPNYVTARINLGNALVTAGRLPEAIAELDRARQLDSDDPQIYYNLGTALAGAGRPAEAIGAFEKSLQLNPQNADTQNNLGNVLFQVGRESDAIAHYRAALALDPNLPETHFNLGRALRSTGDGSEALAHYRESLRLAPGMAEIWNSLGSFLFRLERLEEAVSAYAEAVRLRPESSLFHNNLGTALTESHRIDEAVTQFRLAVQLEPGFADAHYNLGVALLQAGRDEEAALEFKLSGRQP